MLTLYFLICRNLTFVTISELYKIVLVNISEP